MRQALILIVLGLLFGSLAGLLTITYGEIYSRQSNSKLIQGIIPPGRQVIGFLPYWLIGKAKNDYSPYINTLTYFGLTIDTDGKIQQYTDENNTEGEPAWVALHTGKIDSALVGAKKKNIALSLLIFRAGNNEINALVSDPNRHADKLIEDVSPIMKKYGFRDLNLDIESTEIASVEARKNFTTFLSRVKAGVDKKRLGTLTVEISGDDLIKHKIIDPGSVGDIADYIVLMAYDFHYTGSFVTGPVAPLSGAGKDAEYDTTIALQKALGSIPSKKIILGVPLYGYQWETVEGIPRAAIIPGTGQTASNNRVESLLSACSTCSAKLDKEGKESYLIYKDEGQGVYEQIFFPDKKATSAKVTLAEAKELGGIALWALGYEGNTILDPLKDYK